jgi:hypothetical protein
MACRAKQKTVHVRVAARGNPGSNSHPSGSRSMAGPNFRLTNLASTKLLLHSLKYPHQTVNGVFLGRPSETDPSIVIVDAVPLQHHWTNLSPMMEVGLGLVCDSFLCLSFSSCAN